MDGNESLVYIEKIILEIVDRRRFWLHQTRDRYKEKFTIGKFHAREAAYAFLKQSHGESFIKSQKITIWYKDQKLYLYVRDLIYGSLDRISNSMVQFTYRTGVFSEVKWPAVTVNHRNEVEEENDDHDFHFDSECCSINVDETPHNSTRIVPCVACNDLDIDQVVGGELMSKSRSHSFCRDCRVRQSVSDLQRLITGNDETLGRGPDYDDHFRSSIYVHITQI